MAMNNQINLLEPSSPAIAIGAEVAVRVRHGITVAGEALYCGPVAGKIGDFVGLRLSPEFLEHGKNDGSVTG